MTPVPLYRQSYGYSCGPASLVMVLAGLKPDIPMNIELEDALWDDANLKESPATSSYGLALAALKNGFGARVYTDGDGIGFIGRLLEHFPGINGAKMREHFESQKGAARKLGVEEVSKKTGLEDIQKELKNSCYPIILCSSKMMGDWVGIPHWVVVTGINDGKVTLNNPETAKIETYSIKRFLKYFGWGDQTRMICVFNRSTAN